jgi:hypothetical protein
MTPEQWGLFCDDPKAPECANALNTVLQALINSGHTKPEIFTVMHSLMDRWKHVGAYDSEPRFFLEEVLIDVFGGRKSYE